MQRYGSADFEDEAAIIILGIGTAFISGRFERMRREGCVHGNAIPHLEEGRQMS
jgi:hypothetical protein